jgi:hypothetical protein
VRRLLLLIAFGLAVWALLVATGGAENSAAPTTAPPPKLCSKFAATNGSDSNRGTWKRPFQTPQRLVNSLRPGETGCLREGTYEARTTVLRFRRAGRPDAPITVRSTPGERAKLIGVVYVPHGVDNVRISFLDLDVYNYAQESGLAIYADDVRVENNTITNRSTDQCIMLGNHNGGGEARRTLVRRNYMYDCGDPAQGNQEHAIYFGNSDGAVIVDNVIVNSAAYAIHLYPDARHALIAHNVIDRTGSGGVTFSGDDDLASVDNVVEYNVITRSARSDIRSHWAGPVGTGNVARFNCVWEAAEGEIANTGGFDNHSNVVADPLYRDPDEGDYRLQPGSPCLRVVGYDTAARVRRP